MQSIEENISAMMDNALSSMNDSDMWVQLQKTEAQEIWNVYHLIGDTLRSPDCTHASRQARIKVMQDLINEPVLSPFPSSMGKRTNKLNVNTRRHILPALAALAAMIMVTWIVWPTTQLQQKNASTPMQAVVPMPNQLTEYVVAHQEYSPAAQFHGIEPTARAVSPVTVIEVNAEK